MRLSCDGHAILIDCGEGTVRQLLRYAGSLDVAAVFLTHLHFDHCGGLPALLDALRTEGRVDPLCVYGPHGTTRFVDEATSLLSGPSVPVFVRELAPWDVVRDDCFQLQAFAVQHRGIAFGYRVSVDDTVMVVSGDTRPCRATEDAARHADLLIHEATFADEGADRALDTRHSTAREAATVAASADVRALVLTHFSARLAHDTRALLEEARSVFPAVSLARDGLGVHVAPAAAAATAP